MILTRRTRTGPPRGIHRCCSVAIGGLVALLAIILAGSATAQPPPPPAEEQQVDSPEVEDPEEPSSSEPDEAGGEQGSEAPAAETDEEPDAPPPRPPPRVEEQQVEPPAPPPAPTTRPAPPPPSVEGQDVAPAPGQDGDRTEPPSGQPQPAEEPQRVEPAGPRGPRTPGSAGAAPAAPGLPGLADWSGFLQTSYRLRSTHHESDQDLYQTADLQWGDPRLHRLTLSFRGRLWMDIDEQPSPTSLVSITDTHDSRLNGRVLAGHVDLHRTAGLELVRVGRQAIPSLPEIPLVDGALLESREYGPWKTRLRLFAGVPTHLWESSPDGDSILGAGVDVQPHPNSQATLEVGRVRDSLTLSTERNEYAILRLRQRVFENLRLRGETTYLERDLRDYRVEGTYVSPGGSFGLQLSCYQLLRTQRQLVTGFDPYTAILGAEQPHVQLHGSAWKDLGERFTIEGGVWVRELEEEGDESLFNHEFLRAYLTPTVRWPDRTLELSLTGEWWEADAQSYRTIGFQVTKELGEDLRISAGSEYALYQFNQLLLDEDEDVRTWFLRVRHDVTRHGRLDVDLGHQRDDRDTYRLLTVRYTWRF